MSRFDSRQFLNLLFEWEILILFVCYMTLDYSSLVTFIVFVFDITDTVDFIYGSYLLISSLAAKFIGFLADDVEVIFDIGNSCFNGSSKIIYLVPLNLNKFDWR